MRMKVSNYISEMLVKAGINQAFMVTGGGAMHLDDALGHQKGLHCIYEMCIRDRIETDCGGRW